MMFCLSIYGVFLEGITRTNKQTNKQAVEVVVPKEVNWLARAEWK